MDYKDENMWLMLGDCLERMKEIPDGSVDMVLTDPPYGMNLTPQRATGKFHKQKIKNDGNLDWSDDFFKECYRVLPKKDCGGFFFCSHHSVGKFIESGKKAGFEVKNLLVWDKDWFGMGGNWRPNFELILLLTKGRFVTHSNNKSNILKYRRLSGQKMVHPTEKIVPLLELIVEPDYDLQTILDPFMGSGTTGLACRNLNRKFIGVELDKGYFDIAKQRIEDAQRQEKLMNIVSFSGGKDSTAMLLMMLEKGIPVDRVICVDTTKEFPQMYEHIEKVQAMIEPLKIEIVKIDFDYWFGEHVKTRGKKIGEKGYGFPDFRNRWCTALKREAVKKLQKTIPEESIQFHGIAFDEKERTSNNKGRNIKYPLVEWQITENQALDYCYSRGLDWGGLYEKFHRVSCWCCPLSRIGELRVLYNDFPKLWSELEEMDKKSFRKFRSDYTVADLSEKFANENL